MTSLIRIGLNVFQMRQHIYLSLSPGNAPEMGGGHSKPQLQLGHITMCPSKLGAFLALAFDPGYMP